MDKILSLVSQPNKANLKYALRNDIIDINMRDRNGKTALHHAVYYANTKAARELARCGIDVNVQDKRGKTVLHVAIELGLLEAVKLLLRQEGIKVDLQDNDGNTCLHRALQSNVYLSNREAAVLLMENLEANVSEIENKQGKTVLEISIERNNQTAVQTLVKSGVKCDRVWSSGLTPLQCAIENNCSVEIVNLLLSNGALIHQKGVNGYTALETARKKSNNPKYVEAMTNHERRKISEHSGPTNALDTFSHASAQHALEEKYLQPSLIEVLTKTRETIDNHLFRDSVILDDDNIFENYEILKDDTLGGSPKADWYKSYLIEQNELLFPESVDTAVRSRNICKRSSSSESESKPSELTHDTSNECKNSSSDVFGSYLQKTSSTPSLPQCDDDIQYLSNGSISPDELVPRSRRSTKGKKVKIDPKADAVEALLTNYSIINESMTFTGTRKLMNKKNGDRKNTGLKAKRSFKKLVIGIRSYASFKRRNSEDDQRNLLLHQNQDNGLE